LVKPYEGTAISAGAAACVVGQIPILPEAYHVLPVYHAAAEYWDSKTGMQSRAAKYQSKYEQMLQQLIREYSSKSDNLVIDDGDDHSIINPNLTIRL
jgi:hypothetical protein